MIRTIFLVSAVFILSNCASTKPEEQVVAVDSSTLAIHCTKERPTGTRIPITVCRSKEQIERERALGRTLDTGISDRGIYRERATPPNQ